MVRDIFKESIAEPKRDRGALIPLFERLANHELEDPLEIPCRRYYSESELFSSIQREVFRILNTRSTAKKDEFEELMSIPQNQGLVHMFGLADFSQFDGTNGGDRPHIARLCEIAIGLFEPRLKKAEVTISTFDKKSQALVASIKGWVATPHFQQEITFPMTIAR